MSRLRTRYLWPAVAAGAILLAGSLHYFPSGTSAAASPQFSTSAAAQPWEACQPHFRTADDATTASARQGPDEVRSYFDRLLTNGRLQRFADEIISWTAKVKLITSGQAEFNQYVSERFATLVLSERDLDMLVDKVMTAYGHKVDAADNKLALAIRTDAEAQAGSLAAWLPSAEQIHKRFAEVISAARASSFSDLPSALARETTTNIVGEVLTQCGAPALASAGTVGSPV